ncbi:hypothetical protein AGABI1DRAFT_131514 [Agaricus bisporus var. burnettii JB137-S8]|uniref:DUF6534 domain-containing protein n=1 Tax=Agaricus bisporus var. burnettii (strain JB137-S8 / ATCC MYA-4627 / FGSC 10392) TaxID=597362 RepID=K5VP10_AGABU|nr:uncharacterized protein AGABI1DRAFT_131514 [Agaricus bisporus var. burnettii JB137-S8]EKM76194.1 hypothetical protein AGABI1DRAFT_131514 [Agaricus bisporus var. burnettii JB137-S8]
MESSYDSDTLAPPFVGFVIGTALFGATILQAYQYFKNYSDNSIWMKLQVSIICLLDALHLVFSSKLMYTFFISNFGSVVDSTRNVWSFKAIGITQSILIVCVQMLVLAGVCPEVSCPDITDHVFFNEGPTLEEYTRIAICLIVMSAIGVGVVVCYKVSVSVPSLKKMTLSSPSRLHVDVILSFGTDSEWMIYLGFGATTILDISIALMMCFVLHKNKLNINQHGITMGIVEVLSTLIKYAFGTGLLTAFASFLVIVSFVARPNTLFYIGVSLSVPRLYTNSFLVMLNIRRQLNDKLKATPELEKISGLVFDQHAADVTSVFLGSEADDHRRETRTSIDIEAGRPGLDSHPSQPSSTTL